jgi:hypothetical protein
VLSARGACVIDTTINTTVVIAIAVPAIHAAVPRRDNELKFSVVGVCMIRFSDLAHRAPVVRSGPKQTAEHDTAVRQSNDARKHTARRYYLADAWLIIHCPRRPASGVRTPRRPPPTGRVVCARAWDGLCARGYSLAWA